MHPKNIDQMAAMEKLFQMSYPSAPTANITPVETITPTVPANNNTGVFWPIVILIVVGAGILYYTYYQASLRKDQE